jgi:hypothetical protein
MHFLHEVFIKLFFAKSSPRKDKTVRKGITAVATEGAEKKERRSMRGKKGRKEKRKGRRKRSKKQVKRAFDVRMIFEKKK